MYKTIHIPRHIMYVMQGMLKPALILPKSVDTSSFFPVMSTLASTEVTFYSSLRRSLPLLRTMPIQKECNQTLLGRILVGGEPSSAVCASFDFFPPKLVM